ncbi:MAG: fibronectin type III domain-containing protein [Acidobacteriota bacterium]
MTARLLSLALTSATLLAASAADAQVHPRFREIAPRAASLDVKLDFPAGVEVVYGTELFDWTGRAESFDPAELHDVRLTGLIPDREYFYQVLVDGQPMGEVLTFRTNRSWVTRRADLHVLGDVIQDGVSEQGLADRVFADRSDVVLALGGEGDDELSFAEVHGRSLGDRLVVAVGGTGDRDGLRLLRVADMAVATAGDEPLLDGKKLSAAGQWLVQVLPTAEDACWKVVASAQVLSESDAAVLAPQLEKAGVELLLSRATKPGVSRLGAMTWLRVSDPETAAGAPRNVGKLHVEEGKLSAILLDESGSTVAEASAEKVCPLPPARAVPGAEAFLDDSEDGEGFSDFSADVEPTEEECDQ